jgi:polysaccharide biosynthesis protein PslH
MKICKFVEGSFIPSLDGASHRFENISKNLSDLSVDLTIVHCYRGWSDLETISNQNFRTFAIPSKYYYRDYSVVDRIIKSIRPDLVEMNDIELLMSTGLYVNNKFKVPLVFEAHFVSSVFVKDVAKSKKAVILTKKHERFVTKIVSGITCFTDIDKKDLVASTKIDPNRIGVIPLGSDLANVKFRKISDSDNKILFLGNMYFQPNQEAVEVIINKIAPLVFKNNNKVSFKFVGDVPGDIRRRYQSERVEFLGRVADINEAFKDVRVCIVPVKTGGGMRVKILTSMASGVPIISTKIAADGISYGKFINIASSTEEFAEKILEVINNLPKSLKQGKEAYQKAKKNYSWREIAKKNISFYKTVIKHPIESNLTPIKVDTMPYWLDETIQKGRFSKVKIDEREIHVLGYKQHHVINQNEFNDLEAFTNVPSGSLVFRQSTLNI